MPNPHRARVSALVPLGFCRMEIQKVLREYHARGVPAQQCLEVFCIAHSILTPGAVYGGADKKGDYRKWIGDAVRHTPIFFAKMVIAITRSEKRIASLPASNVDHRVEQSYASLAALEEKRKLAEALPGLNVKQLRAASARISVLNRIAKLWMHKCCELQ